MELELQQIRQEVAGVRRVRRNVVLRARIEILFRARDWRCDALVLLAQLPPGGVVVRRRNLAREHSPAPFVDQLAERQEGDLVERHFHLLVDRRLAALLYRTCKSDRVQIRRRHRQIHRIADRLVEAIVRAALEQIRLILVREVIEHVTELVIDGHQMFLRRLDALLDAHIVVAVHVPGTRVTLHVAIGRLFEQRAFPEGLRKLRKAERHIEVLGRLRDLDRIVLLLHQRTGDVQIRDAWIRFDERIDLGPLLSPHVTQELRGNRLAVRDAVGAVGLLQLAAHVAMQVRVQRRDLLPQA